MCDKKLLDNITPFNELFYKSCFYNSLFSVVTHFNKDLIPFSWCWVWWRWASP